MLFETLDDVIREARKLAERSIELSEIENDPDHEDYPPSWGDLDDARAEFVFALADLELID